MAAKGYGALSPDDGLPMTLSKLCTLLRRARRAYVLDDSYASTVAFIDGFDMGRHRVPLAGFADFLRARLFGGRQQNRHWSYLIVVADDNDFTGGLRALTPELDEVFTSKLLDLLGEYAEYAEHDERESEQGSGPVR